MATYGFFQDAIISLQNMGLLDVIFPFILIYVVVYVVLGKSKVLGDIDGAVAATATDAEKAQASRAKKYCMIVSFVFAMLFIAPHVLYGGPAGDGVLSGGPFYNQIDPVDVINNSIPQILIWLVVVLMFMILIGAAIPGLDPAKMFGFINVSTGNAKNWVAGIAAVIVVFVFGVSANFWPPLRELLGLGVRQTFFDNPATAGAIMIMLTLGIVVYWISN